MVIKPLLIYPCWIYVRGLLFVQLAVWNSIGSCVDSILQHPTLVIVSAQAKLSLLVRVHRALHWCLLKPLFVAMSLCPSSAISYLFHRSSFWAFDMSLEDIFALPLLSSSTKLHNAMALVPSDSSLNKPGSLLLHLFQDNH